VYIEYKQLVKLPWFLVCSNFAPATKRKYDLWALCMHTNTLLYDVRNIFPRSMFHVPSLPPTRSRFNKLNTATGLFLSVWSPGSGWRTLCTQHTMHGGTKWNTNKMEELIKTSIKRQQRLFCWATKWNLSFLKQRICFPLGLVIEIS